MASGEFAGKNAKALVIGISTLATVIVGSVVLAQISEGRAARLGGPRSRPEHRCRRAGRDAPPKQDSVPHFATEKERREAALKELDAHFRSGRAPLSPEATLLRGGLLLTSIALTRPPPATRSCWTASWTRVCIPGARRARVRP